MNSHSTRKYQNNIPFLLSKAISAQMFKMFMYAYKFSNIDQSNQTHDRIFQRTLK